MFRELKTPFFTVLFIFLGLLIFIKLAGPIPFSVNSITTQKTNLFTVQGTGEATAIPDTAMVNIGVSKNSATVLQAQEQVNTIINQLTTDIKKLGIEEKDIKTVNYSVNPNYDYREGTQKINGYMVNANIQIKINPVERANQVIDIATKAGATDVGNIQFVLNEEKKKELEEQARKTAITEAKTKAESLAKTAGIRLGKIVDIQESGSPYYAERPVAFSSKEMGGAGGAIVEDTQINPGENKITSNVSISYETY